MTRSWMLSVGVIAFSGGLLGAGVAVGATGAVGWQATTALLVGGSGLLATIAVRIFEVEASRRREAGVALTVGAFQHANVAWTTGFLRMDAPVTNLIVQFEDVHNLVSMSALRESTADSRKIFVTSDVLWSEMVQRALQDSGDSEPLPLPGVDPLNAQEAIDAAQRWLSESRA